MSSAQDPDAPQPPGSPMRQDAAEGPFAPGSEREELPEGGADGSSADHSERKAPPITHDEPEQSAGEAIRQEENAETTEDQPSQ